MYPEANGVEKGNGRPSWLDLDLEEEEGRSKQGERKEKFRRVVVDRRTTTLLQLRAAEYFSGTSSSSESAAHICYKVPRPTKLSTTVA